MFSFQAIKTTISLSLILLGLSNAVMAQGAGNLVQGALDLANAYRLTNAQVATYSKQAVQKMDAENPVAGPNDPYTQRLNRIVSRLRTVNKTPINYKVYLVKDVNAFATADGSVRVFKGLMDLMSDQEVLAVIGHEIGHVANQDSRDAMKQALQRSAIRNGGAALPGVIGSLARSQVGGIADQLVGAKFSRKQETEADDYSYNFLKRNGYNVTALATSFEKLAKASGGGSNKLTQFMSSHPDSQARAKRIRDRARQDGLAR
ncbi:M48 family metallopeptidase [Spirosoma sp. KUDC1026]|uniref:M48 family metallopeptidase n=1 Tax=Spirosoma sp. KUDC1026 TaxID=2745947 RepID=UPI00293BFA50|nr:M48 family metallopeptidase [Spirosoma sp. KUDC1026]